MDQVEKTTTLQKRKTMIQIHLNKTRLTAGDKQRKIREIAEDDGDSIGGETFGQHERTQQATMTEIRREKESVTKRT